MMRWDVVDALRRSSAAKRFAQIVTLTTSEEMLTRPEIARFAVATTLLYSSPEQRAAAHLAGRSPWLPQLPELIEIERSRPTGAEIVFLDPWHTYADSIATLRLARAMLSPRGGWMVVHDCNPPARELAGSPEGAWEDAWCGSTWRAFLDFTADLEPGADWCVVDTDYGVGVIRVPPAIVPLQRPGRWRNSVPPLIAANFAPVVPIEYDDDRAWGWLEEDRSTRLRLVSPTEWLSGIDVTSSSPSAERAPQP